MTIANQHPMQWRKTENRFMLIKTKSAMAVAAAAMALSFGAHAAPSDSPATADAASATPMVSASGPQGGPGMHHDGHGPRGPREHGGPRGPGGPGGAGFAHMMDQLHTQLKLNPQQEKAWQEAQATSRQNFETVRTQHEVSRQQFMAQAEKPILDLSALQAQHEQQETNDQQLRTGTERAFINFYDTLNDAQKTMVSNDIKQHWKHMMHGGPGRDHGHPDGPPPHMGKKGDMPPPGDAPPPPPAPAAK